MRVGIFGPLTVVFEDRVLGSRDFSGVKPKQLLEILVAERGHAVSKARLADLLWGDALPKNHLATLETYVSVLRQTLQPGTRARDSVLVTEHAGYRLDTTRTTVDLDEFDELLRSAVKAAPATALQLLRDALALARGQVLEDEPYAEWAEEVRTRYQQRQVHALIDAARLSLLTSEVGAAIEFAERAVSLNPLAEAGYQVLMLSYYSTWRQEEALQAFDTCRRLLADELGVDPLDQTVALHLAILRHEDVASLLPSQPVPAAREEHVEEAVELPLIGRKQELDQLLQAVHKAAEGQLSVILVTGESGIGKTRLAEAVTAHSGLPFGYNRCSDLESNLPYVALALALRPLLGGAGSDPMPVLADLLRRSDQAQPFDQLARMRVMEGLADALRAHGPFLVVLDDIEWADHETIAALGYLRRRCPDTPGAVLLTCQTGAVQPDVLRKLPHDLRVDLGVLSRESLSAVGSGDELADATGGHPLFVAGWLQARRQNLPESFPPQLRERVITRCWDLGPQAYRLLTVASVLDEPFSAGVLAALVKAGPEEITEELDQLAQQRLLNPSGESFTFHHPPVREILSETLSPAWRFVLQQRGVALGSAQPLRRATDVPPAQHQDQRPERRRPSGTPTDGDVGDDRRSRPEHRGLSRSS
jgi:DNA-binding SARP family transcriptional activator